MSRLHERKIKHQNMSSAEKISCNCDMCKGLNIYKNKRKSNIPEKSMEDIAKEMKIDI